MILRSRILMLILALALGGTVLAACGDDGDGGGGNQTAASGVPGNGIDRAFIADMIPHHESAVEMAKVAQERGESGFVKGLAKDIIETQNAEISTMRSVDEQLKDLEVGDLGVADHMKGMDADMAMLEKADPFDKAFIDMMVPHHQGAIEMAKVELDKGENPELKQLAQAIIDAQQREIDEMNDHRQEAFGAPVPESNEHGAVTRQPQATRQTSAPRGRPARMRARKRAAMANGETSRDRQHLTPVVAER